MAPPSYSDLGKQSRDVFGKGYHFGLLKLDIKTKTESGVEFNNEVNFNQESGKVFGTIESKHKLKEYGITLTEKINTDNVFSTNISVQDQIVKGLKLTIDGSYAPQTGSKTSKLKTAYINNVCSVNCDMDIDRPRPLINTAAVFKYQNWVAGYQLHFDTQKKNITKNNFAIGFSGSDFVLHASVDGGQVFDTSIFQKVSPKLDYGISFNWAAGSNNTRYGIGCKYALDEDASVRTKINNACQIGLGYQQKLRDGITLTLSALIDGKNFNGGSHKMGVGFEVEA